ncbi:MAG: hypothetical protein R3302_08555 [Sulfurimonadaceae bacterium]|nr:hypothetical protein [Sulfurimonadaceae bacterium]
MRKMIHFAPSQEDIYKYNMQKSSDATYDNYRINLATTTETQKEYLGRRFGIALRILEDEPYLILSVVKEY